MRTFFGSITTLERESRSLLEKLPVPGSPEELERFSYLQDQLSDLYRDTFADHHAPRTVVVIPSLSLDAEELAKITGVHHYEERLLFMLMLLRMPCTHLIIVTSQPIHPAIIDYYLHLLPGIPGSHARRRLELLSCHDSRSVPLTQKILERPRLLQRMRNRIALHGNAHMACFNTTRLERSLSVALDIPLYGCDPALAYLGSKSGSRETFRAAGVDLPDGFERLRDEHDVADALINLRKRHPGLRKAVVKLNEGFSGEGNASFSFDGAPQGDGLGAWIRRVLAERLRFEAREETWDRYRAKFKEMGGIVEAFVEAPVKRSPSVQCRINPVGELKIISTHDQVLGGPSGQVYEGCTFPADPAYRQAVTDAARLIGEELRGHGVLGRFGIDFISVQEEDRWTHYGIEINLRKGGTTHPFLTLQFLTDGTYNPDTGIYLTPTGQPCFYYASDNLQREAYKGLLPDGIIDISVYHGLHFDSATQQGVVFHLIGATSEFGKLGVVCIGNTPGRARAFYEEASRVLDQETDRAVQRVLQSEPFLPE